MADEFTQGRLDRLRRRKQEDSTPDLEVNKNALWEEFRKRRGTVPNPHGKKPEEAPSFGHGFMYGLTGYKPHEKAEEKLLGLITGEIAGYIGTAVAIGAAASNPGVAAAAAGLKGIHAIKRAYGAKKAVNLWTSKKGRKLLQSIGYSPEKAARLSRLAANDLSIEATFQTGKLGVSAISGTENDWNRRMIDVGIITGLTPLGAPLADKAGQGLRRIFRRKKMSPEEIAKRNDEGEIIKPGTQRGPRGESSTFDHIRNQEFIRNQMDWMKGKAYNALRRAGIHMEHDRFARPKLGVDDETVRTPASSDEAAGGKPWDDTEASRTMDKATLEKDAQRESLVRRLRTMVVGESSNLRDDLRAAVKAGHINEEESRRILREYTTGQNIVGTSHYLMDQAELRVWSGLTRKQYRDLNKYTTSKATQEVYDRFMRNPKRFDPTGQPVPPKSMLTRQAAEDFTKRIETAALRGDLDAKLIVARAHNLFRFMKEEILQRGYWDEGMISRIDYDDLKNVRYIPREFLHVYDQQLASHSLRDILESRVDSYLPGIRALGEGIDMYQNIDTRELVAHAIGAMKRETLRNRLGKEMLGVLQREGDQTDNLLFRYAKNTDPFDPKSKLIRTPGYAHWDVYTRSADGQANKTVIEVHRDLAKDLREGNPMIGTAALRILRTVSGRNLLAQTAVGRDPSFGFFVNAVYDILQQFMTDTAGQRSSKLWTYSAEMAEDIRAVLKDKTLIDVWARHGGPYFSQISHEAGQARAQTVKDWVKEFSKDKYKEPPEWLRNLDKWTSYATRKSETTLRLAAFRRHLKNTAAKRWNLDETPDWTKKILEDKEAVADAIQFSIEYVNFQDRATLTRVFDGALPFLQANANVARAQIRAMSNDPLLYTWKATQLTAVGVMLYLANRAVSGDAYEEVSAYQRGNYYVMMTPFEYIDQEGKTRHYYLRIPKDGMSAPFVSLGESIVKRMVTGEYPSDEVRESWNAYTSISPVGGQILNKRFLFPPVVQAWLAYFGNKDVWYNEDVWSSYRQVEPHAEVTGSTSRIATDLGGALGFSPVRGERAFTKLFTADNPFLGMMGLAYKGIAEAVSPTEAEENWLIKDFVDSAPGLDRLVSKTNRYPKEAFEVTDEIRRETATWRAQNNKAMDAIIRKQEEGVYSQADVNGFLSQFPEAERKRLERQAKHYRTKQNYANYTLLRNVALVPGSRRAEALYRVYRELTPSERERFLDEARTFPGIATKNDFWTMFNELESRDSGRGLHNSAE